MNSNADYLRRINGAIDYIVEHLGEKILLEQVARAAHFSPFHFHRVFRLAVGETLGDFVKRLRLERSLYLLSHHSQTSMTAVASACGFVTPSNFSRVFKHEYGVAPRKFDVKQYRLERREGWTATLRASSPFGETPQLVSLPPGDNPDGFVMRLVQLPARNVAYLRVSQPYRGNAVTDACERLVQWARQRGLQGGQWLGYTWDDPDVVPLDKCRYDVGLEVDELCAPDETISMMHFAPMQVAELTLKGSLALEQRALDWMYSTWLPSSGFAPYDQPTFEAWEGEPFAHGMDHFELRLQLPVRNAHVPL